MQPNDFVEPLTRQLAERLLEQPYLCKYMPLTDGPPKREVAPDPPTWMDIFRQRIRSDLYLSPPAAFQEDPSELQPKVVMAEMSGHRVDEEIFREALHVVSSLPFKIPVYKGHLVNGRQAFLLIEENQV